MLHAAKINSVRVALLSFECFTDKVFKPSDHFSCPRAHIDAVFHVLDHLFTAHAIFFCSSEAVHLLQHVTQKVHCLLPARAACRGRQTRASDCHCWSKCARTNIHDLYHVTFNSFMTLPTASLGCSLNQSSRHCSDSDSKWRITLQYPHFLSKYALFREIIFFITLKNKVMTWPYLN